MKVSRRKFITLSALAGGATLLPIRWVGSRYAYAVASSPKLAKWSQPLRGLGPNGIPVLAGKPDPFFPKTTMFEVTAGEFKDQLHPKLGETTLWGYWDTTNPVKRHLGGVVIIERNQASRMRFTNKLPPRHILPVDTTIPGANQAQNRIAIHLHGGHIPWISDGGPFDWWGPDGTSGLSFQHGPGSLFDNIPGKKMQPGQADYFWPNDQSTRLMWYHDHAFGITRLNAYAGLATGYLVIDPAQEKALGNKIPPIASTFPLVFQDKVFVDNQTLITTDPTWAKVARNDLQSSGSLWYEHVYDPKKYRRKRGTIQPDPSIIPHFFGDTMLCNGTVAPFLEVEPKRYRFLMLNACNARNLNLNLLQVKPGEDIETDPETLRPKKAVPGPKIIQIGTEGGYLVQEVIHTNDRFFNPATFTGNVLLGGAERADVIIDFTGLEGKEFILYNDAPAPYPMGDPAFDFFAGNPATPQATPGSTPDTRQILRIKVGKLAPGSKGDPQPPGAILNPTLMDPKPLAQITTTVAPIPPLVAPKGVTIRDLVLAENYDQFGRRRQLQGTTRPGHSGKGFGMEYLEPPTEVVQAGAVEVWRVFNATPDTHPMHIHMANFQVLSRQPFTNVDGAFTPTGAARGPEPHELGWKETVMMNPAEATTLIMKFDLPAVPFKVPSSKRATIGEAAHGMALPAGKVYNETVWHCHILEHEEHDMMRPLVIVGQNPLSKGVTPQKQKKGKGKKAGFTILGDEGPYVVASDHPAFRPVMNGDGFTVEIPGNVEDGTVASFTVKGRLDVVATVTLEVG